MNFGGLVRGASLATVTLVLGLGFGAPAFADDLEDAVAAADATAGAQQFRQCSACHTVDEGGANRVGPNLWGVLGRDVGAVDGFRYSRALSGAEDSWSLEALDAFIENPRAARAGTTMGFPGVRNETQRMNVLAYLASLGASEEDDE